MGRAIDHKRLREKLSIRSTAGRPVAQMAGLDPVRRWRQFDRALTQISATAQRRLLLPKRRDIAIERHIPYLDSGREDHTLDIYAPVGRPGPWPVLIYVHGGGFAACSK